jgi:hypothetical protein
MQETDPKKKDLETLGGIININKTRPRKETDTRPRKKTLKAPVKRKKQN